MGKILIIDDEASVRKFLRALFEKNGYEVVEAEDGNQGIKIFKEQGADLILTDLVMPRKEGLETIRDIMKSYPDTDIIAMSGGGMINPEVYLGLAKKLGAKDAFCKPFDKEKLIARVKELLPK